MLSKNKRPERRGKVQLIDAGQIYHKLRKVLGNKRNETSPEGRSTITRERIVAMLSKRSLSALYDEAKVTERENAEELTGKDLKNWRAK